MDNDFSAFRQRWTTAILGSIVNSQQHEIVQAIGTLSHTAEEYLQDVEISPSQIWPDLNPVQSSVNFRQSYNRLRTLAIAYSVEGTSMYRNPDILQIILRSLDLINGAVYNSSATISKGENWWNYKIGAPQPLIDIAMILYDELGPGRRQEYASTVLKMIGSLKNPTLKSANRANICEVAIGASILLNDHEQLNSGRSALFDRAENESPTVLSLVKDDDGFYDDGSYISHHIHPYNGGYGLSHLLSVSKLAFVLHRSPMALNDLDLSVIYRSIRGSFAPFVFRGMIMGNVRGRAISRKDDNDITAGHMLIQAVSLLSQLAPEIYKEEFKTLALSWQEEGPAVNKGDDAVAIASRLYQDRLISNSSTKSHDTGFQIFPASDRVVFHQKYWSAAVAMSSVRTGIYESINSENLRPFHQADGFLQVYLDNNQKHFVDDYYPTMDSYHVSGVTAGQNQQEMASYKTRGHTTWAGGVSWKDLGAASLDYISNDKGTFAKKSWFFLPNALVALGTDCRSIGETEVHTTVDVRKLQAGSPRLIVDGEIGSRSPGREKYVQPTWAHLETIGGYLFFDMGDITVEQSTRTAKWTDINQYPDYVKYNETVSGDYTTLYHNHGLDPLNGSYAYAILPNITASETAILADDAHFQILANSEVVQAVAFNQRKTFMATFWAPGAIQDVQASTPCHLAWGYSGREDQRYTVTLSDPTQQASAIEVWLGGSNVGPLISKDTGVDVDQDEQGHMHIRIDALKNHGRTYKVVFERSDYRVTQDDHLLWFLPVSTIMVILTLVVVIFIPRKNTLYRLVKSSPTS